MTECPSKPSLGQELSSDSESSIPRRNLFPNEEVHLKVYLRVRSCTNDEIQHCVPLIPLTLSGDGQNIELPVRGEVQKFNFSQVFGPNTNQEQLFDAVARKLVDDCLRSANGLIFDYGVTNAGKTYTMQGSSVQPGIIPRALDYFFELLKGKLNPAIEIKPQNGSFMKLQPLDVVMEHKMKDDLMKMKDQSAVSVMDTLSSSRFLSYDSIDCETSSQVISEPSSCFSFGSFVRDSLTEAKYSVWVSFVEIYNEHVFDLLLPVKNVRNSLKVCERKNEVIFIRGVKEVCVLSGLEAYKLLLIGQKNLRYASTKLNHQSSRSHCIFTLKLISSLDGSLEDGSVCVQQLAFCDLAGSERYCKTQSAGERLHEACVINCSLMTLGRCIETIRNNQTVIKENRQVVPFRESKLTRLFKPYFTGKGQAIMIVNISPCSDMLDETLNVLRFTAIAKEVILSKTLSILMKPCRPTRHSIDRLRKSLMPGSCDSIKWASPKPEEVMSSSEEEDEEDERVKKLVDLVHLLQQRLIEAKQENFTLEQNLRQELCDYFMEKLKEEEQYYKDRMIEEREDAEELADKRIELMTDYMHNIYKRAREEDGIDSSQEKDVRVAELETEVKVLEDELEKLKENLSISVKAEAEAQEKKIVCELEINELKEKLSAKRLVDELGMQMSDHKTEMDLMRHEQITELNNEVAQLRENEITKGNSETIEKKLQKVGAELQQLHNRILILEEEKQTLESCLSLSKSRVVQMSDALSNILRVAESVALSPRSDSLAVVRPSVSIASRTIYYSASSSESDDSSRLLQRDGVSLGSNLQKLSLFSKPGAVETDIHPVQDALPLDGDAVIAALAVPRHVELAHISIQTNLNDHLVQEVLLEDKCSNVAPVASPVPQSPELLHIGIQTDVGFQSLLLESCSPEKQMASPVTQPLKMADNEVQTDPTDYEIVMETLTSKLQYLNTDHARLEILIAQREAQLEELMKKVKRAAAVEVAVQVEFTEEEEKENRQVAKSTKNVEEEETYEPRSSKKGSRQVSTTRTLRKRVKNVGYFSPEGSTDEFETDTNNLRTLVPSKNPNCRTGLRKTFDVKSELPDKGDYDEVSFRDGKSECTGMQSQKTRTRMPLSAKTGEMLLCSPRKNEDSQNADVQQQVLRRLRHRK